MTKSALMPPLVGQDGKSPRRVFRFSAPGREVFTVILSRMSAKRRTSTTLFAEFDCGYTLPPYSRLTLRPSLSKKAQRIVRRKACQHRIGKAGL